MSLSFYRTMQLQRAPWGREKRLMLACGYTGTYLGIEVAIKEVLPSNDYDVAKYFEREWRLMKWVLAF